MARFQDDVYFQAVDAHLRHARAYIDGAFSSARLPRAIDIASHVAAHSTCRELLNSMNDAKRRHFSALRQ